MYKRQKYFCEFDDNWLNVEEYKCWLKKIDKYNAQCFLCKSSFTTKNDGKLSLTKHSKIAKHIQNISNLRTNMCLKNFVLTKNCEEHEKVTIAEVCTVYHGIKHNQSYVSMSCNTS